jgi:hypothetical protein
LEAIIQDVSEDDTDYASCYRISKTGFLRSRPLKPHCLVI